MKTTKVRPKNESSKKLKSNKKNGTFEDPNTKFKNEAFKKLCQRNNASKERLKTIDYNDNSMSKKMNSPRSSSNYKDRGLKDSQKKTFKKMFGESKSKKNMEPVNQDKNEISFGAKSKKVLRGPNNKKLKDYPNNLIGGVLHQVNYYNENNNSNYNDNVRYKPIDDIFNEQSPISAKKPGDNNNNNSPNMSFNSDIKPDIKSDQNYKPNLSRDKDNNEMINNIRKIKVDDDNDNNNDNIYNNYNVENEMKVNPETIKTRKNDTLENNGRSISPIMSPISSNEIKNKKDNTDKNYINDIMGDINNNNKIDNINDNKINEDKDKNNYNKSIMNKKDILKHLTPKNFNVEDNKVKEPLNIEKVNNFLVDNDFNTNDFKNNNFMDNLEISSVNTFTYNNYPDDKSRTKNKDTDKRRSTNFENLKFIQRDSINYINDMNKPDTNYKYDDDGKLKFNNDDEVLDYIKRRIKEEKDSEYNDKLKYNYFILTKKFHGKILYEIGLENDLNSINNILQKENVEIEHEPVIFVKKKDLDKIKNNIPIDVNNAETTKLNAENQKLNKENEKLNEENDKLYKENEKLKKQVVLINQDKDNQNIIQDKNTKLI